MLVDLAASQLPQFGVNVNLIRAAFLNSTTVSSQALTINTTTGYFHAVDSVIQLIRIQYTVYMVNRKQMWTILHCMQAFTC